MAQYGSPPRWRAWATGDPVSPRRVDPTGSPRVTLTLPAQVEGDPNARAVEEMERGFAHYKWVRDTTDPRMWAWSKPLWQALFGTASALTQSEASPQVTNLIRTGFYDVADSLPCRLCAAHFQEKLDASFPRVLTSSTLSQWMRELKAEVDERVRRRKMGLPEEPAHTAPTPAAAAAAHSPVHAQPGSPAHARTPSPIYKSQGVSSPKAQRSPGLRPPPGYVSHVSPLHTTAPQNMLPPTHGGAGGYTAPPGYAQGRLAMPTMSYSPTPTTPSPPRTTRTPWAELQAYQATNGLCLHGALAQYCDLCTQNMGSPVRAGMR